MLTQGDFINIEKQAAALYESLELEIIEEIATRIAKVGCKYSCAKRYTDCTRDGSFIHRYYIFSS